MNGIEMIEFDEIITPDGETHNLNDLNVRALLSTSGEGMPPLEWHTTRGPYEHGETPVAYRLRPRIIQMIVRWKSHGRSAFWDSRYSILDILRPNRTATEAPWTLRKQLPDGSVRCLHVRIAEGPTFKARNPNEWDEWAFEEVIRLIAHNPVWFDLTEWEEAATATEQELIFPIDPFIVWGPTIIMNETLRIAYEGTWHEWPTIVLTGPLGSPKVTNLTIDEKIELNYEIHMGEVITITLEPGNKTCEDQLGNNLLAYITEDSDLATFRLEVAPVAPGGVNEVNMLATGVQPGVSEMALTGYNRYIGI